MGSGIIPFEYEPLNGRFNKPSVQSDYLDEVTIDKIIRAWDRYSVIDKFGRIWIHIGGAHTVLRTNKANASYLIGGLPNDQKYRDGGDLYVKGESICYLLDSSIQNARNALRENYIKHSQLLYIAVRDCSRARELRFEHYEYTKKLLRSLKRKRINEYGIQYDELTGEELHRSSAEFSHIRSYSIFPHLASFIDNGLIINKRTHNFITENGVNDEEELYQLCQFKGWNTLWYDDYLNFISIE